MALWIVQFFSSLPSLGFVVAYALGGCCAAMLGLFLCMGLTGQLNDPAKRTEASVPNLLVDLLVVAGMLLGTGTFMISFFTLLGAGENGKMLFEGFSRWVGFQMMVLGPLFFGMWLGVEVLWKKGKQLAIEDYNWCRQTIAGYKTKRARDPENILKRCRENFTVAKEGRFESDNTNEIIAFDQAGDNLLTLLEDLLKLVARIDQLLAVASDDTDAANIFPDVPTEEFLHLVGTNGTDREALSALRTRARGIIKAIIRIFKDLPVNVAATNVYRQASQINGLQEELTQFLPKTTSSTGVVAEMETGRLHTRLLQQLRAPTK